MQFTCTKTYGHSEGLSTTFRQWRADSHCSRLHGYALKVSLTFTAEKLNRNGWVFDFGGLKPVKAWLKEYFDHRTLVAEDDPLMSTFVKMQELGLISLHVVERTGIEAFAKLIGEYVDDWLETQLDTRSRGVRITMCQVWEHEGNMATWMNPSTK